MNSYTRTLVSGAGIARGQKGDMATPAGLEPATCRLEGGCSIQLSYGARRALCRSGVFSILF
jgi:hypothetical protein